MAIEIKVLGGYYVPGKTPQVVDVINDMMAVGWQPVGSPLLSDVSGWVSQMIMKVAGPATAYTVITGYDNSGGRQTPLMSDNVPVSGWYMLGSPRWLSSHYYLQAWTNAKPYSPELPIDLSGSDVTGILPIAKGGTGNNTGNAATATKLQTARTILTNLASGAAASFDGSANVTPGVTGILPIANGGTGNNAGLAASATKLATARGFITDLSLTASALFDGTANATLGVQGVLPVSKGGTGVTTTDAARAAFEAKYRKATVLTTEDLNTLRGPQDGQYMQSLNTNATAARNYPDTKAGVLNVMQNSAVAGDGCTQLYWPWDEDIVYTRRYRADTSTWTAWVGNWVFGRRISGIGMDLTGNGAIINLKQLTTGQQHNIRGLRADDAVAWVVGNTSGTQDTIGLQNVISGSQISLLQTGEIRFLVNGVTQSFEMSGAGLKLPSGLEVGNNSNNPNVSAGTSFIDFHSSGSTIDRDARIEVTGGSTTVVDQANLAIRATKIQSIMGGTTYAMASIPNSYTGKCTVDANGFVKAASPIVNLYGDGTSVVNDEAAAVTTTRLGVGHYKLFNTLGLNSDATWWIEVPKDVNGQPLVWIDYTVAGDGSIEVFTYHRVHPESPAYARNIIAGVLNGDARDIPSGKYVTLRVNVPV